MASYRCSVQKTAKFYAQLQFFIQTKLPGIIQQ